MDAPRNVLLDADVLTPWLARCYGLPTPVGCERICRGFNDTYRVEAGGERLILRVYFNDKYYIGGPDDFRFELDLLAALSAQGVPVAAARAGRDGRTLASIDTEGGVRWAALFAFADGVPARGDAAEAAAPQLGETLARLHIAADAFRSPHPRYHLNLEYLVDRPLREIAALLESLGRAAELEPYLPTLARLGDHAAAQLPRGPGAYGIIHGDLHGGNVHLDADARPTLFDFDHGGYGWRAYDLATLCGGLSLEAREACLERYAAIRPLDDAERASMPLLAALRPLWDVGDVLGMRTAWGRTFDGAFADQALTVVARLCASDPTA